MLKHRARMCISQHHGIVITFAKIVASELGLAKKEVLFRMSILSSKLNLVCANKRSGELR